MKRIPENSSKTSDKLLFKSAFLGNHINTVLPDYACEQSLKKVLNLIYIAKSQELEEALKQSLNNASAS